MACDNFGLTINTKKTEMMQQPAFRKPYVEPNIAIKQQRLKRVEKFTYFGSTFSKSIVIDDEVNIRLAKASAAFGRLKKNVWNRRGISDATKIKVYQSVVLTTLLYGCERLNTFRTTCLRKIPGNTWRKHIPDTKVLTCLSFPASTRS